MKIFVKISTTIFLLAGIIFLQFLSDTNHRNEPKPSPFVPPAEVVRAADLGLDSTASSLFWLSSIQYFGDWQEDDYQKLLDYIETSIKLDPKFSYPYAFGVLILPALGNVDEAIEIAKKGIEESDPDWRIPYYLATTYHIKKNDQESASKYFDIAARTKGAPETIVNIAASYGTRPDIREQTKQIWLGIYETSNDEVVRERAKNYIIHLEILDLLESSAKKYHDQFETYPDPLDKLVEANILKAIPKSPFGFEYYIDQDGRARIK